MMIFQGIFLAILYCFCNSEVQVTIRRQFKRIRTKNDVRRSATLNSSRHTRGLRSNASCSNRAGHTHHNACTRFTNPGGNNGTVGGCVGIDKKNRCEESSLTEVLGGSAAEAATALQLSASASASGGKVMTSSMLRGGGVVGGSTMRTAV